MISPKQRAYRLLGVSVTLILIAVIGSFSLLYSFILASAYALFALQYDGHDARDLFRRSCKNTLSYYGLYLTIAFIGAIVSMWLSSGAIATMIYYGFNHILGVNFLLISFLITSVCALFIGSAVGTFSTIGLILISIGTVLHIPRALLIGTMISGSFVADRISPISGLTAISLSVSETKYNASLKRALVTLVPAISISALIYYILGRSYILESRTDDLVYVQTLLHESFVISPWLFLIPAVILILSLRGLGSLYTIFAGVLTGALFSIFLQGYSLFDVGHFLLFGYQLDDSNALSTLLHGGGILNILDVVWVVMSAVLLIHILMHSGMVDILIGSYIARINGPRSLIHRTCFLSMLLTVITCDQTVGIFLPIKLLRERYDHFHIPREVLVRSVSDTGIVIAPLLPWNINHLIILGVIGAPSAYMPYAVFCYIVPVLALLAGFYYPSKSPFSNATVESCGNVPSCE